MLSACDRLLLAAAAPGCFDPAGLVGTVRAEGISWPEALRLAASNRVASFVAELVEAEPLASCLGSAVRSEWRALRMLQVFRAEAARRQLDELGAVLGRAGVAPLVYKGLDFQARCYAEACPRGFADLDIVVRREDTVRSAAALEAAGYSAPLDALPLDYLRRFHLHASYLHPAHRLCVELHWALDSPFADGFDSVPLLFAAAERSGTFGPDLLRPAAIDALALMAIHLEKHLGLSATLPGAEARLKSVIDQDGLIWVLDVVRWMRTQGVAADGDAVLRRIRELRAERSLSIALRLARDLDPPSLGGWACELAARLPRGRPWLSRLVYPDLSAGRSVTRRGRRRRAFLLSMQPRLGFRPLRVLESLLPPFRVPGTAGRGALGWSALLPRRLARLAANLLAIRRSRRERRAIGGRRARLPALTPPPAPGRPGT